MTVLATHHTSTAGWVARTLYDFHLDFNLNPGEIHIKVMRGTTTLWDTTVNDSTFSAGQFGFFNNSQANVHYAGFEQTGGVIPPPSIPEPTTFVVWLLLGICAIGARRVRRRLAA